MNIVNPLTDPPRMIPDTIRKSLYMTLFVAGLVIATGHILDVNSILTVTLDKWQELLTYYGTVLGLTAFANVGPSPERNKPEQ